LRLIGNVLQVYGENMAILAGDALLTFAFEHIARDTKGVAAERIVRVIAELGRASGTSSSSPQPSRNIRAATATETAATAASCLPVRKQIGGGWLMHHVTSVM